MAASALRDLAVGDADCAAPSALVALADHVDAAVAAGLALSGAGSAGAAGAAGPPLISRRAHALHGAAAASAFRPAPPAPTQAALSSFRFHDVAHALPPPTGAMGDWASDYLASAQSAPPPAMADPLEAYWSATGAVAPSPPTAAWADDYLHQQQETATLEQAYAAATWADEFAATGPTTADAANATATGAPADSSIPQLAAQVVANVGNSKLAQSNLIAFMRQVRDGAVRIEGNAVVPADDWAAAFLSAPPQLPPPQQQHQQQPPLQAPPVPVPATVGTTRPADVAGWEAAYLDAIAPLRDQEWDRWQQQPKGWRHYPHDGWGYEGYNRELYQMYRPQTHNHFLSAPADANLAAEAERALGQGHVADALLLWEAAVAREPTNAALWYQLGQAQALAGNDELAIPALHTATRLRPALLGAWLALAASYANENARPEAFQALASWLQHHPTYRTLAANSADPDRHRALVMQFLQAARQAPGPTMDADVQDALGLLFNMSNEGDKAVDCFTAATHARPTDAVLWNRLGASLANSGKPEQAVGAYERALQLNPHLVRARVNLGISCMALGATKQAAEHLLSALALQRSGGPTPITSPSSLWDMLRMAFLMMERGDLAHKCDARNVEVFRPEWEF